jgi:hypothetical protein
LPEDGFIEIVAVPNLEKLSYTTTALIGLQTMPGKQEAVAYAVVRLEEVHYVAITSPCSGHYLTCQIMST